MHNSRDATKMNKGNSAYLELKNALINCEFKPGLQLRVESLAEHFRASVTPIREALIRLHAEGFIVTQAGRGFFIKPMTHVELAARYKFACQILHSSILEHVATFSVEDVEATMSEFTSPLSEGQNPAWKVSCREEALMLGVAAMSNNVLIAEAISSFNEHTRYFRLTDFDMHNNRVDVAAYLQFLSGALASHNHEDAIVILRREFDLKLARMARVIRECNARALEDLPSCPTVAIGTANGLMPRGRHVVTGDTSQSRHLAHDLSAIAR